MELEYKFYYTRYGCMGHVGNNKYQLFTTVDEYTEWYYEAVKEDVE